MQLDEYLKSTDISVAVFAQKIGAKSRATIYRYMNGDGRVPSPEMMQKIHDVTSGQVTANDFYNLSTQKIRGVKK